MENTNAVVKVTIKDKFVEVREILADMGRTDLVEFIDDRIEKTCNKKSSSKPKACDNEDYKAKAQAIVDFMTENPSESGYTITELIKSVDVIKDLSTSMVTTIVKTRADIVNTKVGKKSTYNIG